MTSTNSNKDIQEPIESPHSDASPNSWVRHSELYLRDGNVVLLCENTLFRVYGGVLAMNSQVFKDMFSLEGIQPTGAETYDGCPCIRLPDQAKDIERLLNVLLIAGFVTAATISFRHC
jgi:hypothetical protein